MSGLGHNAASIIQLGGVMRFRGMRTAINRICGQKKRAAQLAALSLLCFGVSVYAAALIRPRAAGHPVQRHPLRSCR
jgi:hypothetical protein